MTVQRPATAVARVRPLSRRLRLGVWLLVAAAVSAVSWLALRIVGGVGETVGVVALIAVGLLVVLFLAALRWSSARSREWP